jgi:hypothetical protein
MTPLQMIAEWEKGCTCAGPAHDAIFKPANPTSATECEPCTQGLIDALKSALATTTLVKIGYLGFQRVYINLTKEEAEARYIASEGQLEGSTEVVTFTGEEFWAYDVGAPL